MDRVSVKGGMDESRWSESQDVVRGDGFRGESEWEE